MSVAVAPAFRLVEGAVRVIAEGAVAIVGDLALGAGRVSIAKRVGVADVRIGEGCGDRHRRAVLLHVRRDILGHRGLIARDIDRHRAVGRAEAEQIEVERERRAGRDAAQILGDRDRRRQRAAAARSRAARYGDAGAEEDLAVRLDVKERIGVGQPDRRSVDRIAVLIEQRRFEGIRQIAVGIGQKMIGKHGELRACRRPAGTTKLSDRPE